jgi:uncharacterized protein YifE (UPF0438 family)
MVINGESALSNSIERAWLKYLKLTTCKTKFHTLFGRSKMAAPVPQSKLFHFESDGA